MIEYIFIYNYECNVRGSFVGAFIRIYLIVMRNAVSWPMNCHDCDGAHTCYDP